MTYVLAIVYVAAIAQYKPFIVAPMPDRDSCFAAAMKANNEQKEFLESLGHDATHACLKLEMVGKQGS